jgi:hypothetical protein
LGYIRARKRGIFPAFYGLLSIGAGIFIYYRMGGFYEYLARRFNGNIVHGLGMALTVITVVLILRLLGVFIDRLFDIEPHSVIAEIAAGFIGLLSGLLWVGLFTKVLYFLNLWGFRQWIAESPTYKFIMPMPEAIYSVLGRILQLITPGGA